MPINDPFLDEMSVGIPRGTSGAALAQSDFSPAMIDDGGFRADYERKKAESQSGMSLQEKLMADFNDNFERANNDYQGLLSVGAPPEVAAASTIKPVLAKYAAMTPLIRSFTGNTVGRGSGNNSFRVFNTGDGGLTGVDLMTREAIPLTTSRAPGSKADYDALKFYRSELSKVKSRMGDRKYRLNQDDLAADAASLQQKIAELEGSTATAQPGITAPGMDADPFGATPPPERSGKTITDKKGVKWLYIGNAADPSKDRDPTHWKAQ